MKAILDNLARKVRDADFLHIAASAMHELAAMADAYNAVEPMLRLIEANECVDFGAPGPLVHFVERFYRSGYEDKLVDSVRRSPTRHNLWMLNRMINAARAEEKEYLLTELDQVVRRKDVTDNTREAARQFLSMHENRNGDKSN